MQTDGEPIQLNFLILMSQVTQLFRIILVPEAVREIPQCFSWAYHLSGSANQIDTGSMWNFAKTFDFGKLSHTCPEIAQFDVTKIY